MLEHQATIKEFENQFGGDEKLVQYHKSLLEYRKKKREYADYLRIKMRTNRDTKVRKNNASRKKCRHGIRGMKMS